jgi:putative N6-adenine-specific DNA methylase
MARVELIATAPFGLEAVVAREVKDLGYTEITTQDGRVTFVGDEQAICRANLWLRTADRVLVKLGEFPATTFDELFEGTKSLPWADWIPEDATFPVDGKSVKSQLSSVPACQGIVKKAIVSSLQQTYNREWFEESGPKYSIMVSLLKDVATLTLDTTGVGLHKRGYRQVVGNAPIKETLAAALILLSRWNPNRILLDPLCGSGTIPLEAALIGKNMAPGLEREFDAEKWDRVPEKLWQQARVEARDLARPNTPLQIIGSDIDPEALGLARYHTKAAGFTDEIVWRNQDLAKLDVSGEYGCVITNPPYGERIGDLAEVEKLYRDMGKTYKNVLGPTWSYFVLTSHQGFERIFAKKADKKRKLFNGRIECNLYQYLGPLPPRPKREPVES